MVFFVQPCHILSSTSFRITFKLKVKISLRQVIRCRRSVPLAAVYFVAHKMKYLLLLNFPAVIQHFHFEPIWYLVRMTCKEKKSITYLIYSTGTVWSWMVSIWNIFSSASPLQEWSRFKRRNQYRIIAFAGIAGFVCLSERKRS